VPLPRYLHAWDRIFSAYKYEDWIQVVLPWILTYKFPVRNSQARKQPGTPGVAKRFLKGAQILKNMSNTWCPKHFPGGARRTTPGYGLGNSSDNWQKCGQSIRPTDVGFVQLVSFNLQFVSSLRAGWMGKMMRHRIVVREKTDSRMGPRLKNFGKPRPNEDCHAVLKVLNCEIGFQDIE